MQTPCPRCHNSTLERVPRSLVQRVFYRKVLLCATCGYRLSERRMPFEAELTFLFSMHTRCIQCGSLRVRRLPRRDVIDRMSAHPLSVLAGLLRAPIYHCNPCRLQYRDWRLVEPAASREVATPARSTDVA